MCILWLSVILFCTAHGGADGITTRGLVFLKVLSNTWEMEAGHTACGLPLGLTPEHRQDVFLSLLSDTQKTRLSLVGIGANELSRIFLF